MFEFLRGIRFSKAWQTGNSESRTEVDLLIDSLHARNTDEKWKADFRKTAALRAIERGVKSSVVEGVYGTQVLSDMNVEKLTSSSHGQMVKLDDHPVLLSKGNLTIEDAVDALARVENAISKNEPDLFVTTNEGGNSIARVVLDGLRLRTPVAKYYGDYNTESYVEFPSDTAQIHSVCIVGHVAETGQVLEKAIELTKNHYGNIKIYVAVLAASRRALNRLHVPVLYHGSFEGNGIAVPFDLTAAVRVSQRGYTFSGKNHGADVLITRDSLVEAREKLSAYDDTLLEIGTFLK